MSFKYKSFCLGIIVTSITWIVILYMYNALTNNRQRQFGSEEKSKTYIPVLPATFPKEDDWLIVNAKPNSEDNTIPREVFGKPNSLPLESFKKFQYEEFFHKSNLYNQNVTILNKKVSVLKEGEIKKSEDNVGDIGLLRSLVDQKVRDDGYRQHAFNLLVSSRLSYHREIPDTRNPLCKSIDYPTQLPAASIIICFYNEANSVLLRTIHSVLSRTPEQLIEEIILVDDFSDIEDLHGPLEDYLRKNLNEVRLVRTSKREGLIRARMFGAHHAKGQVLVFLDSHCEVNQMWLEPLLNEIARNTTSVVCPIIDIINADTFVYTASPIVRGGFNWGLHFKWDGLPSNTMTSKKDFIKPIKSPTMAGGLFAIDRLYFKAMGEYDAGMDTWGGENLEISFRVWMCGGSLTIIPCSRVGHIFRRRRPYSSPTGQDTVTYNSLRVAHVWMDQYKEYYFKMRPDARNQFYGNVTDRLELRKRLGCKSFDWYMKNIYPELKPPNPRFAKSKILALKKKQSQKEVAVKPLHKRNKPQVINRYQIHLRKTDLCVESEKEVTIKGSLFVLKRCRQTKKQIWFESDKNEFILAELLCLDATDEYPKLAKCHEMGGTQSWKHMTKIDTSLYNTAAGMCLGVKAPQEGEYVTMEFCTQVDPTKWDLVLPTM